MPVKKYFKILTTMVISSSTLIGLSILNKAINMHAISKNLLETKDTKKFVWRFGDIIYRKRGSGAPVLLIHSLDVWSSSIEWDKIINQLSKKNTVYAIDLLGCGVSEKPFITYTNHIFSQLINDFIKYKIGKRTTVIASGNSSSFVISACDNENILFEKIILVSPEKLQKGSLIPGRKAKTYKAIISTSILGNLLYNIAVLKFNIKHSMISDFYRKEKLTDEIIDKYYESSHRGFSPRFLYSSLVCHYTKKNIKFELSKIDNSIIIVEGRKSKDFDEDIKEYVSVNPAIESVVIDNSMKYPHIENEKEFLKAINIYL